VIVLYSILDMLPLIFLKQAQDTVGESDFIYRAKAAENVSESVNNFMYQYNGLYNRSPAPETSSSFVNCTQLEEMTKDFSNYNGVAPRWFAVGDFSNPDETSLKTSGIIMILDTEKEKEIGLGRDFTKTLLGPAQAFVTSSALRYLNLEANNQDAVTVNVDLRTLFSLLVDTDDPLTIDNVEEIAQLINPDLERNATLNFTAGDFFDVAVLEGKD
jgi:hypothetical protein